MSKLQGLPLQPPLRSNGGWRGRPLPTFIPIRCAFDLVGVMSATPPVAEWTTTTTASRRGAPTSRFALATTPNAPRRNQPLAPWHAQPLRSGGGRQGACQRPPFPLAAVTPPAFRPPPCHFAPDKDKVRITTPSGYRESRVFLRVQCCPRPSHSVDALSRKSVRERLQGGWAARRWQLLVGPARRDWQRFQCRVAGFYFHRVSLPVQFWRACGCPPAFRPRLPWWQPFVFAWLRLSGWRR